MMSTTFGGLAANEPAANSSQAIRKKSVRFTPF